MSHLAPLRFPASWDLWLPRPSSLTRSGLGLWASTSLPGLVLLLRLSLHFLFPLPALLFLLCLLSQSFSLRFAANFSKGKEKKGLFLSYPSLKKRG